MYKALGSIPLGQGGSPVTAIISSSFLFIAMKEFHIFKGFQKSARGDSNQMCPAKLKTHKLLPTKNIC